MDPVVSWIGGLALALLFAGAAVHKARDRTRFAAILADYEILPARLAAPAGLGLIVGEAGVALALLVPATRAVGALLAAALLLLYGAAIAINLARGRRTIDCGCGGAADQPLSEALLLRNGVLVVVALVCSLGVRARPLVAIDGLTIALAVAALASFWHAAGQLYANRNAEQRSSPRRARAKQIHPTPLTPLPSHRRTAP